MDVQITKKNGESFTLEQFDILVKDFIVSSIPLESEYGKTEGSNRNIDYGGTYGTRTITVPFVLRARDLMDFPLLRDVLFSLVNDTESYYIREMRRAKKLSYAFVDPSEPPKMDDDSINQFVGGKRYLVRLQNTFDIEQIENDGEGELVFETTELSFAESVGTTKDIDDNGITYESELWSYGMGLLYSDEAQKYTHNTRSFRIYNAGNIPRHHPFEQELKITIRNASQGYQLSNKTTGDIFKFNDQPNGSIVIDGPVITDAGLIAFRKTNGHFITLAPGWNDFEQNQDATVSFDFRFYYL